MNENAVKNFAARESNFSMTYFGISRLRKVFESRRDTYSRHVPLKFAPQIAVCRSDEDRSQGTEGADDGKSEELMISLQPVLRESTKILESLVITNAAIGRRHTGMLTAIEENSPMMTLRPVKALYAVFIYVLVIL
jgi:hypothetical protein